MRSRRRHIGFGLELVDASLVGGPIERLVARPISELSSFDPGVPLDESVLLAARRHRILPLFDADWFRSDLQERVGERQLEIAMFQMKLVLELNETLAVLESAGVDAVVLKGMATSVLDYPEPSLRHTGDIDLLIRPEDHDDAIRALKAAGAADHHLGEATDGLLLKGSTLVSQRGVELDVHTRLTRYSAQDTDELVKHAVALPSGGGRALNAELRLLHAAGHLLWSPPGTRRLSSLVDMSVLLDSQVIQRERLQDSARRFGLMGLAGVALGVEHELRGRDSGYLDSWLRPSALEERAFVRLDRSLGFEHLLALENTRSLRDRVQYCRGFLRPSRASHEHHGGALAYYGRLLPDSLRRRRKT